MQLNEIYLRLILWSKSKIHSPSRAARKSLQMPCPPSEALLPFSSTSLHHSCPSVHLPSTHQCQSSSHGSAKCSHPLITCIIIFCQSMHKRQNVIFAPSSKWQLTKSMKQSHLMGTHSPPCGDELPLPCTATKAGSGDAPFDFPVMALTSEDSFLIWFSSSASKLRPDCLLASTTFALAAFC